MLAVNDFFTTFVPQKNNFIMRDIQEIARYIGLSLLSKGLSVSPLKLQKILYYVQSWYMVFFGRKNTLFAEVPQAWVNGPVYPCVYHQYKDCVPGMCDHLALVHFSKKEDVNSALEEVAERLNFTVEEQELIESVIMLYGSKTQNELILYTHAEKPWAEKREGLPPYQRSDCELSLDTMYSYYKARHDKNRQSK